MAVAASFAESSTPKTGVSNPMEASTPERTFVRTCGLVLGLSPLQSEIWTGPAPPACRGILA
jgi:hypothetical protein